LVLFYPIFSFQGNSNELDVRPACTEMLPPPLSQNYRVRKLEPPIEDFAIAMKQFDDILPMKMKIFTPTP
jgi:hypothetical protein